MKIHTVIISILLAAGLTACGSSKKQGEHSQQGMTGAVVKGIVRETAKNSALPETLELVGTVRARTTAVVAARIAGSIAVLNVREGDRVRKGQVMARLEAQENLANSAVAIAGIEDARRGVDEAQARKKLADTTFDRYNKLFSQQIISRQEFDAKQTEKELAAQALARAESRLKQAEESSRAAATISAYTEITAPITGIITSKPADLGATVFPAQPLMTIEDEGSYQLELAVPESLAARVSAGLPVQVALDAIGSSFMAKINEIVPAADPASRTFAAKIALAQKPLKSGMFGRGTVNLGTATNGITLPKGAILERGAMTVVWALDKGNIARLRIVKTGRVIGERIEVLSGLSEGEQVLVSGVEKVNEGDRIE